MLDCQQAQASTGRPPPSEEKMSLSGLWQTLVRTHRLPEGIDVPPLLTSIRDRLHDPEKEVRQHALRVLADLILALPKNNLNQHIRPVLPSMKTNLGHRSLAVRKSAVDCVKAYIRHSPTPNDDFAEVIKIDGDTPPNTITGILTSLPSFVRSETLSTRSLEKAIDILWHYSQQCVNEEVCIKSLGKIRWKIGTDTFYKLLGTEKFKPFESLCEKYGLLETPDDECSSSSPEDKVILETEIKLNSGPSIKLQIHEESSDKEIDSSDQGIVRVLEDDSDIEYYEGIRETPRTPRRVHFGGEIVKMRTPESDSTQTSDTEKKIRKSTSATAHSFVRVNENIQSNNTNLINTEKKVSRSLDNLTTPTDNKNINNNTKIPVPVGSVPNSPAKKKTSKVTKTRLHNSAPNLDRTSKIPKKMTEKNVNIASTYSVSKKHVKESTTQKNTAKKDDKSEIVMKQDENIFKINDNVRMIELNIKNNIALQIMFTNGNEIINGDVNYPNENKIKNSPIKTSEVAKEETKQDITEEPSKNRELTHQVKAEFTRTSETKEKEKKTSDISKITNLNCELPNTLPNDTKKSSPQISKAEDDPKSLSEIQIQEKTEQEIISKEEENSKTKKKNIVNLNLNKSDGNDVNVTSPLVDEIFLLQSITQPRRYSRAEDMLSPAPIHNEIEMLHNLTRSPEHSRKNKSRPTTATRATNENRPVTPTSQKTYESFKIFSEDVVDNIIRNEANNNAEELQKEATEIISEEREICEKKKDDLKTDKEFSDMNLIQGDSRPDDVSSRKRLLELIENLQELDLNKKAYAFDNLVSSLREVDFIKSFDPVNTKSLLQLLFLCETQAKFRKGSRDALQTILEYVPEHVIMDCFPQIAKGIGRIGAPYGVKLAITVMKRTTLAEELLSHLPFESGRGREGSLQILMAACRLFPSTDIDINNSIRKVISALGDRKKRVRHASLETLACLAQVGGNSAIFDIAKQMLKDVDIKEILMKVIRARLSRRQLPMVDLDGNIRYTVPRDPAEIQWISPGGTSNHSAPSQLHYLQRNDLRQRDDLVPLRNTNAAIIPLDWQNSKKITQRRGVLRPVYCILPSPEESDEGPSAFYSEKYGRDRSILPSTEKFRSESQDRLRWRERSQAKRFPRKYDIRKSFSSDQLYHSQPVSLDYRANLTSTSSVSSGSDYSSSNGSQSRSIRWQGSGIPVLRPRGYWGGSSDKLSLCNHLLRNDTLVNILVGLAALAPFCCLYYISKIFSLCTCLKRQSKVQDVDATRQITPVLDISLSPKKEDKLPQDSPSSLRSTQRQSSGSESSGYFTPPLTEKVIVGSSPVERPEKVIKAITPLVSPRISSSTDKKLIESQTSQDEPKEEEKVEVVDYIEVINSVTADPQEEEIIHDVSQNSQELSVKEELNSNQEELHHTEQNLTDEVDKKASCPSINEFDLSITRPIEDNRKWSKSELSLHKSLPIIVDRKNVNSAPLIKDIFNNNLTNDLEETTLTGPTHICNNTNINITIPLPGSLIQEEETVTEPTLVRKLSKRYSQVPVPKKTALKPKTDASTKPSSKPKTNIIHDVLEQMASQEWETVMTGLRNLGRLAKTDKDIIEPHMHEICMSVANHIRNLRSQVSRSACQSTREMFVACSQKGLEMELEEIVGPLLHRTADTNKFLREDANDTLDTMIGKINPAKSIVVLTTKGTTHQNAIVRGTTMRLLENLVRKLGTEKIFSLGKDVRNRVILAGANGLTEGSLETRKHAKMLLGHLISHANFQKALLEAVPPHTIRHIAKTLNSLKNS